MAKMTGLSQFTATLHRGVYEALTKVILDAYFSTTLLEGKSHFAFIGHFVHIPYFFSLEEAYCSVRRYDTAEVDTFSSEIFGPRTALIVVTSGDLYTKEPCNMVPIIEKAAENKVPLHVEITPTIGLQSSLIEEDKIDSLSFMTEAIGAPLGSLLLSKKESFLDPHAVEESFYEEVREKALEVQTTFSARLLSFAKKKRLLVKKVQEKIPGFQELPALPSTLTGTIPHIYGEALAFRAKLAGLPLAYHPSHPAKIALEISADMSGEKIEESATILAREVQALQMIAGRP